MYDVGLGIKIDKKCALHLYKIAWRSHTDQMAANNIAILYREAGNNRLAFNWFERAAKIGDGDAFVELAKCYIGGIGVPRDTRAAIRYLRAAVALTPYKWPFGISPFGWEEAESLLRELCPESSSVGD